jgi:hypothetical protein
MALVHDDDEIEAALLLSHANPVLVRFCSPTILPRFITDWSLLYQSVSGEGLNYLPKCSLTSRRGRIPS